MKRYYIKKNKLNEEKSFFTLDDIDVEKDPENPLAKEVEKTVADSEFPLYKLAGRISQFLDKGVSEDGAFDPSKVMVYFHRSPMKNAGHFFFCSDWDLMERYYKNYSNKGMEDMTLIDKLYLPTIKEKYKNMRWKDAVSADEDGPFTNFSITDRNTDSDWLLRNCFNLEALVWETLCEICYNGRKIPVRQNLFFAANYFMFNCLNSDVLHDRKTVIEIPDNADYFTSAYNTFVQGSTDLRFLVSDYIFKNDISFQCLTNPEKTVFVHNLKIIGFFDNLDIKYLPDLSIIDSTENLTFNLYSKGPNSPDIEPNPSALNIIFKRFLDNHPDYKSIYPWNYYGDRISSIMTAYGRYRISSDEDMFLKLNDIKSKNRFQ